MCVDYRALNKITIKNRFPISCIDDILDRLEGSKYFSRIDLKSGYHQVRVVPKDVHKTTFCTSFGLYKYLVVRFGLTNASATFNCMMERNFRMYRHFASTFFNNILLHSKTLEEHYEHLDLVFKELQTHQLSINMKKKSFSSKKFCISAISFLMVRSRWIQASWRLLKNLENVHQVRSFLGLHSYYRKFI